MKRKVQKGFSLFWLVVLLIWGAFGVEFILRASRSLPWDATTSAVVLATDGASTGVYEYRYSVGDRICRGEARRSKNPTAAPGAEIQVHYDPKDVCQSVAYDPVSNLVSAVWLVAWTSSIPASLAWSCWPHKARE